MSGWELKDLKAPNVDLRLNIFSLLAPLLAILVFYFMVHGASKGGPALFILAIVLAGITFFLSLLMAITAILRKEPRRQLSIISLLFNGAICLLFISRFFVK
jgi:zinc transporter ZupT